MLKISVTNTTGKHCLAKSTILWYEFDDATFINYN